MPTKKPLRAAALAALVAGAAGLVGPSAAVGAPVRALAPSPATQTAMAANAPDHDDPADHQWNAADVVPITLTGAGATSGSSAVTIAGSRVTITAPGTYQLTGTLNDGQVVVDSDAGGMVRLILNGA